MKVCFEDSPWYVVQIHDIHYSFNCLFMLIGLFHWFNQKVRLKVSGLYMQNFFVISTFFLDLCATFQWEIMRLSRHINIELNTTRVFFNITLLIFVKCAILGQNKQTKIYYIPPDGNGKLFKNRSSHSWQFEAYKTTKRNSWWPYYSLVSFIVFNSMCILNWANHNVMEKPPWNKLSVRASITDHTQYHSSLLV